MGKPIDGGSTVDWRLIFDLIASEYGYTWRQFTGMTYKLLNSCLEAINRRTHNNIAIQAAMRGIKLSLYKPPVKIEPPSKEMLAKARSEIYNIFQAKQAAANGKR